jgi:HAD superfamily 5'-nucleotidase-like hydrolase
LATASPWAVAFGACFGTSRYVAVPFEDVQLQLPLFEGPDGAPQPVDASRRVYVSRDLKMVNCDWVGFDMDYTLAIYHQQQMDQLSIEATVDKLITRGYPDFITKLHYPLDFAIRGLLIHKHLGNVLKMNRFKVVRKGYHGLRELSRNELRALYYEKKIRHKSTRYHWIDTLYALSEACMYAAIINAFEERGMAVKYGRLFTDIRECIDLAHRDGAILNPVMKDTARFIERDPRLAEALHKLRSAGKKLFVLTNSRWEYTQVLLSYLFNGALPDYPSFEHYFDAIVVASCKPGFFEGQEPLMMRQSGELVKAELPFERGTIYQGGNIGELQQGLGVTGNRVLYVGDHIYGDMVRSKKDSAWRTAMIIPELEAEVGAYERGRDDHARSSELYNQRHELEDRLRHYQRRIKDIDRNTGNGSSDDLMRLKSTLSTIRRQLRGLEREATALRRRSDQRFHPYWGSLLKEANELSLFGHQVSEYACVYTSRVSNLLSYSPHQYFRSPHNLMHHEL